MFFANLICLKTNHQFFFFQQFFIFAKNKFHQFFFPLNYNNLWILHLSCQVIKKVITMGVFVSNFDPCFQMWYLPLVDCAHSLQISHPHSWIIYKSTHDITSIYPIYYIYCQFLLITCLPNVISQTCGKHIEQV